MFDLLIMNGTIVDGSGRPAFQGNVVVNDGKIVSVGEAAPPAKKTIDAKGKLVTPGWVDMHSHMDGQASWDPLLSPASNHGITTLVMGNCGIGFAPCKPDEHELLINVVEDVEDIPGAALAEGVTWAWETFPEYLDALEKMPRAIDIAAQVPHCAVRTYVMGRRGVNNESASERDVQAMAAIVKEGIAAGALGFTTSRTQLHTTRDGQVMPGTYASENELLGIGRAIGELGKGFYGLVSDFDDWQTEMAWMKKLAQDNHCAVHFVLFFRKEADFDRIKQQIAFCRDAEKEGVKLIPHVSARPVNILMGWDATVNPFMFCPSFAELSLLTSEARYQRLLDPVVRAQLLSEDVPLMGDEFMDSLSHGFDGFFELGDPPNYEPKADQSLAARAKKSGVSARELAYDLMLKNRGKNMLYYPCFGYERKNLSAQFEIMKDDNTVLSLADTGAHCGVLCDASVPTQLLSYFVRDRAEGERLPLEWAVQAHTRKNAEAMGLFDRGLLSPGMKADINIIDFEALQIHRPEVIYDLPAGGRRVFQGAEGYLATIVSGEVIMEKGRPTGAMPGRLIRGSQAA
ncbi:MAG: amidohydrolase family protein [Pseudomonadales bacterium]|nr:amidohydrolase family protein [Pseudomonadales bacterium]